MPAKSRKMEKTLPFRPAALGIPERLLPVVLECVRQLEGEGVRGKALRRLFGRLAQNPRSFGDHPILCDLAGMLGGESAPGAAGPVTEVPWRVWGEGLDPKAVQQLRDGCSLPVAVSGALMPDAHVGYGLPIFCRYRIIFLINNTLILIEKAINIFIRKIRIKFQRA